MTTNRNTNTLSVILLGVALILFIGVLIFVVGGWIFSMAWNGFMTPVFDLTTISITEGIWAVLGVGVLGTAFNRSGNRSVDLNKER
jgi:hypothetical protein